MTQAQIESCAPITSILRVSRAWRKDTIDAMRFSDGELCQQFLNAYDRIPELDRSRVPFEAIALAAGVDPRHLLGEIMLAIRERSVSSVKMIAVSSHPKVMKVRVASALTLGGYRDRDKLDEILGALKPSGNTFIGKAFFGKDREESEDEPEESVDDVGAVFPDCEVMQEKVQGMRQKLLEGK